MHAETGHGNSLDLIHSAGLAPGADIWPLLYTACRVAGCAVSAWEDASQGGGQGTKVIHSRTHLVFDPMGNIVESISGTPNSCKTTQLNPSTAKELP